MLVANVEPTRDSRVTPVTRRLNNALFDELTERLGAKTEVSRAALVGIHRLTLYRFRARQFTPSLDVAMRMAEALHTSVERLFGAES